MNQFPLAPRERNKYRGARSVTLTRVKTITGGAPGCRHGCE
jgi:hypothetical protein